MLVIGHVVDTQKAIPSKMDGWCMRLTMRWNLCSSCWMRSAMAVR